MEKKKKGHEDRYIERERLRERWRRRKRDMKIDR